MKTKITKIPLIFSVFFTLCYCTLLAQNKPIELTAAQQKDIDTYNMLAESYLKRNNHNKAALYYNKMAFMYWESNHYQDAIKNFSLSLKSNEQTKNNNALWTINNQLGMVYTDINQNENALTAFKDGLKAAEKMKDKQKIVSSLYNVSLALGYLNKNDEAIKTLKEALRYALEMNNFLLIRKCYGDLSEKYRAKGDTKEAEDCFRSYSLFDKKIKEEEVRQVKEKSRIAVAKANAEKRAKELELALKNVHLQRAQDSLQEIEQIALQRQMEIDLLNKEKEIKAQQDQIKRQKTIKNLFIIGFIIVVIFIGVLLSMYQKIRRFNKALKEKQAEIEEKNIILNQQNKELQEKQEEIKQKNAILAKQNQQINDSIKYASKIQEAILPSRTAIEKNFPNSFIFYKPRDIVSGDFYWYSDKNDLAYIAAVDCTGHSVPGAFMSMIGNTLLNEIVNEKKQTSLPIILEELNSGVVNALKNEDSEFDSEDGMDISICCIDKKNNTLNFAAANHCLYAIKEDNFQILEGDIFSIGDIFSLRKKENFTNHSIKIEPGLRVFMFSDGYQDQFGGKENKKFKAESFKKLIINSSKLKIREQKLKIINVFEEWKMDSAQTDDVLIIGIEF